MNRESSRTAPSREDGMLLEAPLVLDGRRSLRVIFIGCRRTETKTALPHVQQLHLEHQARVAGNRAVRCAHRAVPEVWRNNQPPFSSCPHAFEPLIPSANHVT